MNSLLKSVTILDKTSEFHNEKVDILIENGLIINIDFNINNPKNFNEINLTNLHVSRGWFDSSVCFGEPGFEDRETIENGLKTASRSGFTAVALQPNTNPVINSRSQIEYIKHKCTNSTVEIYPIGALTSSDSNPKLTEMFDMKNGGAICFGNYKKSISNANTLKLALQYTSSFEGVVLSYPEDEVLSNNGMVNENIMSTSLGLKGSPCLSEEVQIMRDLSILEYAGGKLHIPTISTTKSVELIRAAKASKLNVSCSVAVHNLFFSDSSLLNFNTNFKVLPPLRTKEDIKSLIEGVKDGTIDMVTSDHNPLNIELKKTEFDNAEFGTIGLESIFGALNTLFSTKMTIKLLTSGRDIFKIPQNKIQIGEIANLTLFNPNKEYVFNDKHIFSKSKNSIFLDSKLSGKVYGVINKNKLSIFK
ncbi:MAG: dihydroorotase [Flavobacteriaceae bacterium]|nr:dihydroorotase [Flavobacteriaceae bacterium]CAI8280432.1 MAG: Dihydroorotase [Flavobacteriaceae bacterium]|tara:strand:- start:308 stop:1564 length:1257 start_codon:yes stop_codon:yes gene_type:complete